MKLLIIFLMFSFLGCTPSSKNISATNEPSNIYVNASYSDVIYRFNWIRSFHKPLTITIRQSIVDPISFAEVEYYIEATSNGDIIKKHSLTWEEFNSFIDFVFMKEFWSAVNPEYKELIWLYTECEEEFCIPVIHIDGASWELEAVHLQKYRKISDHSPQSGVVRDIGLKMLEMSKLENYGPIY